MSLKDLHYDILTNWRNSVIVHFFNLNPNELLKNLIDSIW